MPSSRRLIPLEVDAQAAVVDIARLQRWTSYHTHDSRGSDAGFPDLVLVRERIIYVEMKRQGERPRTPELDWLILTKRPEFARDWLADHGWRSAIAFAHARHFEDGDGAWDWAATQMARGPENVWLGVSIETSRQTYRADVLREIPAAVRFISAEPLLGSLFETKKASVRAHATALPAGADRREGTPADGPSYRRTSSPLDLAEIDWLIIGGESGPRARPFYLEHARELLNACGWYGGRQVIERTPDAFPAPFVKQLGANPAERGPLVEGIPQRDTRRLVLADAKGGDIEEWPPDLRIREWPSVVSHRVPEAV